jgi:hypothetical protein
MKHCLSTLKLQGGQLNEKIQALANIHELPYPQQRIQFARFMQSVGKLFLKYFSKDLEAAQKCAEGNKKTLENVHLLAQEYAIDLEGFLHNAFEDGGEWETVCARRTFIEAYNAMFGNVIKSLDTADVEESMQCRKEEASYSEGIPKNVPESHWWWFI